MHVNKEKVNLLVDSKTDSNVHSSEIKFMYEDLIWCQGLVCYM